MAVHYLTYSIESMFRHSLDRRGKSVLLEHGFGVDEGMDGWMDRADEGMDGWMDNNMVCMFCDKVIEN